MAGVAVATSCGQLRVVGARLEHPAIRSTRGSGPVLPDLAGLPSHPRGASRLAEGRGLEHIPFSGRRRGQATWDLEIIPRPSPSTTNGAAQRGRGRAGASSAPPPTRPPPRPLAPGSSPWPRRKRTCRAGVASNSTNGYIREVPSRTALLLLLLLSTKDAQPFYREVGVWPRESVQPRTFTSTERALVREG